MNPYPRFLFLFFLAVSSLDAASGPGAPLPSALREKLPPEYRAAADQWLHLDNKAAKKWPDLSAGDLQQQVLIALASEPAAAEFVLNRLPMEPAETQQKVLKVIGVEPFWTTQAGAADVLQRLAAKTEDDDFMLECLDAVRRIELAQLRALIDRRINVERKKGDDAYRELAKQDEYWMLLERGALLPGFWRKAPPVFAVKAADRPIRVVGLGDFGTGSSGQREVAAAMVKMHRLKPFDFGITFGDNFYPSGMTGPGDSRWRDWWETLYGPLGVPFYPSLGNHEWYSPDGAAAEILYRSPSWRLPAEYYTFTAGPVQFFAVDTTDISEAQALWLKGAIAASTARWKVVYGHHPIFAPEPSDKALQLQMSLREKLWPLIRGKVDAYLCGHQHAMAHMDPQDGVHFFLSGGGGAPLSAVSSATGTVRFSATAFGFFTLEADSSELRMAIYDGNGHLDDSEAVRK